MSLDKCSRCGEEITGYALEVNGKLICKECFTELENEQSDKILDKLTKNEEEQ